MLATRSRSVAVGESERMGSALEGEVGPRESYFYTCVLGL